MSRAGRLSAGLVGTVLLVTGLFLGVGPLSPQPTTPTATVAPTSSPTPSPPSTSTLPSATGLTVTADATSLTTEDEVAATIEANAAGLEVTASLRDYSDGTVIASKDVTLDASGVARVSFGTRPAGRYVVDVTHVTRGRARTTPITVESA